jgi:predicted amidophosphoribosyltransferase
MPVEAIAPTADVKPPPARRRRLDLTGVARRRVCPDCGQPNDPENQFCTRCGRQIVEKLRRCGKCGAWPAPGDRFCIFCGEALGTRTA